jgi:multidrug resistance efflux pump
MRIATRERSNRLYRKEANKMSVKVVRERPCQRRYHRLTAPLYVTVGEQTLRAADWSVGGLRLEGVTGELPKVGDRVAMSLSLPFQGFDVAFNTKLEVVRRDLETAMFAGQYFDLPEREKNLLAHFAEEIIRGSMVEVEDTIQRIDVPVTPVSTIPDPNPHQEIPLHRWPIKSILMSSFYIVLGFIVLGYAGLMIYANNFRMEIQSAVVTAPIETVKASGDGFIMNTGYGPGDRVRAGEAIIHIADHKLERDIDMAELEIQKKKAQLLFWKRRQSDELSRIENYAAVDLKAVRQIRNDAQALVTEVRTAAAQNVRLQHLIKKGFTTHQRAESAEKWLADAQARLRNKNLELSSRSELAKLTLGRRHFTGKTFVSDLEKVEAEVTLADHKVTMSEREYDVLRKQRSRIAIRSPFNALIVDLPRFDKSAVQRGDVVAIFEREKSRHITAYLNQDEILQVGLNDPATIYVPALDETVQARVMTIDRTHGFVDEQQSRYTWRGSKDRSAKIILAFEDLSLEAIRHRYTPGLPVIVIFKSRSTNQLMNSVWRRLTTLGL